jgi:hypothetical protein
MVHRVGHGTQVLHGLYSLDGMFAVFKIVEITLDPGQVRSIFRWAGAREEHQLVLPVHLLDNVLGQAAAAAGD